MIRRLLLATLLTAFSIIFSVSLVTGAPVNSDEPVEVTADRLEADQNNKTLVFLGNAVARQGEVTIQAERLTVTYTADGREVDKVVADGSVRIVQGTRVATGEKAVMYRAEDKVVLTGSPRVKEDENFVQGHEITLFLEEERSVVTGGSDGRVNAVFKPRAEGSH